ncbi:MAG TPA: hypothetical protein VGR02_07575 [Thermoanaerobaculia bacterium]|jgi:hypothetical protein|nr:hypothetical protein [Thermoanaerobaculia bacterium]
MTARIPSILLLLSVAGGLAAQQPATTTATTTSTAATATATAGEPGSDRGTLTSQEIRNDFTNLLSQSPSELPTILKLDPTLLSNDAYLSGYPELARFVAAHPEVRRNPRFYLSAFREPGDGGHMLEQMIETLSIAGVFALITIALAWLVRTIIEQKRWTRLSRIQNEVHNKILDRFSSSNELLEYIKTPAGTKFLESAPIPLHAERPVQNAPLARVMWSIQIGVIVAMGSLGLLVVSGRFDKESAQGLFALGAIAFSIGLGFIASAAISLFLSRRLSSRFDDAEIVK